MHQPALNRPNRYPLAYFLTFTTYGTWLHGDDRGSVDGSHAAFDSPRAAPNPARHGTMTQHLQQSPVTLDADLRETVANAVREACMNRGWSLEALNVRTNHVHVVVGAAAPPERILTDFKAYATRRARERGLLAYGGRLWTRHGSTRYLWTERAIELAAAYVIEGQGPPL